MENKTEIRQKAEMPVEDSSGRGSDEQGQSSQRGRKFNKIWVRIGEEVKMAPERDLYLKVIFHFA